MDNLSYIGLSRQVALRKMMDVTANNMANMNTPGFKSQNMLFQESIGKAQDGGEKLSQVKTSGSYRDLSQGPLTQTSGTLDFALEGEGYFAVQTADGVRYTRAGAFSLNSKGEIVTKTGHQVLSDSGTPLSVQPGAALISATESGALSSEKGSIGKMKIVTFDQLQTLAPVGDNLFYAGNAQEQPAEKSKMVQGMLENSNVQPILEMNKMIEILRMYQSTQNMLNNDHDLIRGMIQKLTRV